MTHPLPAIDGVRLVGDVLVLAAVAAGALSCSSPATTAAPPPAAAAPSSPCAVDDIGVGGEPGAAPTITIPDTCGPPPQLLSKDVVTGDGPEMTPGSTLQAQYLLVMWSNKQELDSSWKRGESFELEDVGNALVIDGWNEGLVGMKRGGRRLLVVPPDKGHGRSGNGVAPNETLVFVVDAVAVTA